MFTPLAVEHGKRVGPREFLLKVQSAESREAHDSTELFGNAHPVRRAKPSAWSI